MRPGVAVIGVGQIGGCLAEGLARAGHAVFPIRRGDDLGEAARALPDPALALVAVAEDDLDGALLTLPTPWRSRVALVQNELLPSVWERHNLPHPTVAVVWFERKGGGRPRSILPTFLHGPGWPTLAAALDALGLPWRHVEDPHALRQELVRKNLYILTTNLGGLATGAASAGELWRTHRAQAIQIASEILTVQAAATGGAVDRVTLLRGLDEAIDADPEHATVGRAAPRRLERALEQAEELGISVPRLQEIVSPGSGR
ncbi:MAG TPA: hypothetical protein VFV75_06020 [Candidatus Polarisedimenticolaceae bacterium]|nr:hypothetical protein [Candidatus Polarisedimenticolaceae bacterium]